jgi:hypothetical protein
VLFAAFIHAAWNAVLKTGSDTVLTTTLITTAAACYAAIVLAACWDWQYIVRNRRRIVPQPATRLIAAGAATLAAYRK